jgi:hypothetical protein
MEEKRAEKNDNSDIAISQKNKKVNSDGDLLLTTLVFTVHLRNPTRWTRKRTCGNLGYEYGEFRGNSIRINRDQKSPIAPNRHLGINIGVKRYSVCIKLDKKRRLNKAVKIKYKGVGTNNKIQKRKIFTKDV